MITVCCFLWSDPLAKNRHIYTYGFEHVRVLRAMVGRHLAQPHRFVCITDRSALDDIETVPLDGTHHLPGTRFVKLQLFKPDIGRLLGDRILYLDLDAVVTGPLDPLVDRGEDLVLWRNPNFGGKRRARYNTSILLLRTGSRPEFWSRFDKRHVPGMLAQYVGGTDQAWISHIASPDEAHWTDADGVYGAGRLLDIVPGVGTDLPANARIVFTPGRREPSMESVQDQHPWMREHYR